jgi:hypothetical protein
MIVVDANVVAYLYLPGEHTAHAEDLLQRDPEWAAPVLWRSKFRNILAGYMRRRPLSFEQARDPAVSAQRARSELDPLPPRRPLHDKRISHDIDPVAEEDPIAHVRQPLGLEDGRIGSTAARRPDEQPAQCLLVHVASHLLREGVARSAHEIWISLRRGAQP